jgi:MYXO-CTERM domain-containing protein
VVAPSDGSSAPADAGGARDAAVTADAAAAPADAAPAADAPVMGRRDAAGAAPSDANEGAPEIPPVATQKSGGCGCTVSGTAARSWGGWALLVAVGLALRGRSRRY